MPDPIALVSIYSPATCQIISLVSVYSPATCHTLLHEYQFAMLPLSYFCIDFSLSALPFVRLYLHLQPCNLPDFISLVSVYSPATRQTLRHWFQFTAVPLVRLYFIGFSLQSCHLPGLIYPGSVYNLLISALHCSSASGQNILHQVQGVTWLARIYISLSPGCDLLIAGAGIAQWLERRTRDRKVAGSNPCWSGGKIFFSRVNFLCWLLFRYPFHPRVTAVARKRPRSFCQKRRWQVTAKHAYTLCMWLCMKWHGAWLYGVRRTRRDWLSLAANSCGTSHASAVSTPLRWIFGGYSKTRYKKLFTHVEWHASAVSLLKSGEQRYIKAINNNNNNSYTIYMAKTRQYTIYMAKTRQYTIYMAKTRQRDTPEWLIPSSSWVASWSDAKDTPNEEKPPCQGIRGTARRPAFQEGLGGNGTTGPLAGHQHLRPFNGVGRTSLDGPAPGQAEVIKVRYPVSVK